MSSLSDEIDEVPVSTPLSSPPPVAPLPPPPPFSRTAQSSTTNGVQADVLFGGMKGDPESDGQRAYKYACSAIPDSLDNYVCLSYQRQVEPLLQNGPQCGLVALAMADSILCKEVKLDKLTEISQAQGFSKQGELFSALYMEQLARLSFGCKTSVLDIRDVSGKWEFLNCLARGDVMLVPYDPDKNYVPVLKKGHKAHWALITGFFAAINDDSVLSKLQEGTVKSDSDISNLYHCRAPPVPFHSQRVLPVEPYVTPRALSASVPTRPQGVVKSRAVSARSSSSDTSQPPPMMKENTRLSHCVGNLTQETVTSTLTTSNLSARNPLEAASYILVYAKQGKSKHTGIWNAKTLVESCCNLLEIDPERLGNSEAYTFPEKGIAEELCGKVVVLHNRLI